MAQISLRDYLKGVEEIIDGGQIEDALAHCRHILKSFPKHVDTYRMMGKAYLEAKRNSEASDIFHRVLSSAPDDFVAHIGMSIIREDENNLDAAIWHMERAFEAQPSNRAVQDELRRLYGKREGYELPKVRLTRGALARMYAHGDLYTQAIGELRGALSEDSQRPDLQVLLAEMYLKTNRHAEAIEVCSKIIEKLPYCLYANRAMVDILKSSQREVEAQPYLDRVEELDPYAAQVDTNTALETVRSDSVMVEQLQLETRSVQPLPRAWTGSLQLPDEQGFEKEELPGWLADDGLEQPEEQTPEDTSPEEETVLGSLYGLEPTFPPEKPAADAGFKKSNTAAFVEDQIPDWLRELRPATSTLSLPSDKPAFVQQSDETPEESAEIEEPAESNEIEVPELGKAQEEAWPAPSVFADEPAAEKEIETPAMSAEEEENLGWLESLAAKQGAAEEELLTEPEARQQAQPEWAAPLAAEKPKSDALAWLDELSEDKEPDPTAEESAEISSLAGETFSDSPAEPPASERPLETTTPNWLKDLSEEVEESQAEPIAPRPLEDAPDWLDELRPEAADVDQEPEDEPAEESLPESLAPRALEESPNWLDELRPGAADVEEEATDETAEESLPESLAPRALEDAPNWLDELRPRAESEQESANEPAEEAAAWQATGDLSKLDWLEESDQATEQPVPSQPNVWVPEAQAESALAGDTPAPQPAVSPRVTARMQTAALAPGKLEQARQALNYGKLSDAADHYGYLLRRRVMLDEIIADLSAALRRFPQDVSLWQTLGDAYMRNNQLKEALDCYTKAEDLL